MKNLFLCPTIIPTIVMYQHAKSKLILHIRKPWLVSLKIHIFACIVQFSFLRLFRSKSIYGLIGGFVSYVMLLRFRISWKFGRKTVNNFIHFLIDVTKHSNRTHSHFIVKRHEYSWLSRYAHISCFRFVCKNKKQLKKIISLPLVDDAPPDMNIKGGRSSTK